MAPWWQSIPVQEMWQAVLEADARGTEVQHSTFVGSAHGACSDVRSIGKRRRQGGEGVVLKHRQVEGVCVPRVANGCRGGRGESTQ